MIAIKFRVWDGKKYHHPEATKDEANHYLQFGSNGFWLFNEKGKMITALEVGGICERFTGWKDNKGIEIYEGDILRMKNENNNEWITTVKSSKWCFFEVDIEGFNHNITPIGYASRDCEIQIIGNIQENKDLLKQ